MLLVDLAMLNSAAVLNEARCLPAVEDFLRHLVADELGDLGVVYLKFLFPEAVQQHVLVFLHEELAVLVDQVSVVNSRSS